MMKLFSRHFENGKILNSIRMAARAAFRPAQNLSLEALFDIAIGNNVRSRGNAEDGLRTLINVPEHPYSTEVHLTNVCNLRCGGFVFIDVNREQSFHPYIETLPFASLTAASYFSAAFGFQAALT